MSRVKALCKDELKSMKVRQGLGVSGDNQNFGTRKPGETVEEEIKRRLRKSL